MKRRSIIAGMAAAVTAGAAQSAEKVSNFVLPPKPTFPPAPRQTPDVPRLTREEINQAMQRVSAAPKNPEAGKIGLWVWYRVGDPASDEFLGGVLDLVSLYGARLDVQYFAVLIGTPKSGSMVSFESPNSKLVKATIDLGGKNAQAYAGGQVPGIVLVSGGKRQLVSVGQLEAALSAK